MIETITQNEILRYVYEETSAEETLKVQQFISESDEGAAYFLEILEMKTFLEKGKVQFSLPKTYTAFSTNFRLFSEK